MQNSPQQKFDFTDIFLLNTGIQYPRKHKYGPAVFDHFVLQYIRKGCGTYIINDKKYEVKEGELFVLFPSCIVQYYSDENNPYYYNWIGIHGTKVKKFLELAGLTKDNPVLAINDPSLTETLEKINVAFVDNNVVNQIKIMSLLYSALEKILVKNTENIKSFKNSNEHIVKAIEYIEKYYIYDINITDICKHINLNRNYFSQIFKKEIGSSPIEFLINYRIDKACYLLKNTNFNVTKISELTGFLDSVSFSIRFKKAKQLSPLKYRKTFKDTEKHDLKDNLYNC